MLGERDRFGVGITPGVRWLVWYRRSLLESLGRRMNLLILWADLGQQQWAMLSDGRSGWSGESSVDRVR